MLTNTALHADIGLVLGTVGEASSQAVAGIPAHHDGTLKRWTTVIVGQSVCIELEVCTQFLQNQNMSTLENSTPFQINRPY